MRVLCRLEDIPDGGCRGFGRLFALRYGEQVLTYVNACPHLGVSLDWMPDRFLSADGTQIVCATHGALFDPLDGRCTDGPCEGDYLEAVPAELRDGVILVPEDAGL